MPAEKRTPPPEKLKEYIARGLTQQQMADEWYRESCVVVGRSAISTAISRAGLASYEAVRHDDLLPWQLQPEHRYVSEARYLRLEARRRKGLALSPKEERRLNAWLKELSNAGAVIYYHPDTARGFWWVHREPTDTDIIRKPT